MRSQDIFNNWHIKVICLILGMILVFFTKANQLKIEPVVVSLEAVTNSKYTFTETLPKRVTIIIKGEEDEISKVNIDSISVFIDASDIREDGTYELPILIKDSDVYKYTENVEITVSPVSITAKIEEKVIKYLKVDSVITGIPAHGYELTSRFINPVVISVSGPREHMERLEFIETEPVDLAGKNSDFKSRVRLNKSDSLLSFPEGEFVEFQGIIGETTVVKVIENVNIAVKDLNDDLEIVGKLPQIGINVEGKLLSLQNFTKNNVSLTIHLINITEPGEYEVPITYWTPKYVHVYNKSKDTLKITIKRKVVEN